MLLDLGLIANRQELSAIAKTTSEAKDEYSGNAFVQAIVAELGAHDSKHVRHEGMTTNRSSRDGDRRPPRQEGRGERGRGLQNFLFHVADAAANASGGFFGLGDKVSNRREDLPRRPR